MREAYVKNENTGDRRFFVYVRENGQSFFAAARFNNRANATKIVKALNEAFAAEDAS